MKKAFVILFMVFGLVLLVGCDRKPVIELDSNSVDLLIDEEYELKPVVKNLKDYILEYSVDNEGIVSIENNTITALNEGTAKITILIKDNSDVTPVNFTVHVKKRVSIMGLATVKRGEEITLTVSLNGVSGDVVWSSSDESIAVVSNGVVTGKKAGKVTITATCGKYSDSFEITVTAVVDLVAPVFEFDDDYQSRVVISWNQDFDPRIGIKAIDDLDGDITKKIQFTPYDNKKYGAQVVEIYVEDGGGNRISMTREIEVVWDYDITFIGHAGSFYGLMNSEEAILYAIEVLQYQAIEVDLKQTSDGVFVLCHDDVFGGYTLASTPWSTLKDVEVSSRRFSGIPSQNGTAKNEPYIAKLCTLERFLEICKEYNVKAVIELKYSRGINNNDQSRMKALMDEIEKAGMRENVILLGSQYNCLIWTRNNGYEDILCQYLVSSIENDTVFNRCVQYNLDVSFNITQTNSEQWIKKYKDAGLKVACYTFSQYVDYPELQRWINRGVDFVTCDWHLMEKVILPKSTK